MPSRDYFAVLPEPATGNPQVAVLQGVHLEPKMRFRNLYDKAESLFLRNPNPCTEFAAVVREMRSMIESREISTQDVEAVEHRCSKELNASAYETISDELHARSDVAVVRLTH